MQAQVSGSTQRQLAPITTRTFGRFRLERRIAYGGMAEILLATELRSQKQMVLKRILPQYSSNPEFVQYFIHEGRLGQRLNHENLVETYEAGQVGETCYIALEYLRGATCIELLRAAAKKGLELPLGAAVRIVADAARGLHHAHTATDATGQPLGVVHRDVTPHNLFLCRDGTTKVLDFGIAKAASQLHHTRTGTIKGKFSYLAPEQIRGETIDHRVDVFALGIVLHELLTLKPLFRGVNDADTLQRILTLDVPAPERVRHTVPPGLGAVALRALWRDRERRLPSAAALADSIEAVAEAECIDASPEVVAALLAELCPPGPDEGVAAATAESSTPRSASALGATGSGPLGQSLSSLPISRSGPLPLPPPPSVASPFLAGDDDSDLDEMLPSPEPNAPVRSPSALLATPLADVPSAPLPIPILQLAASDTVPNPAVSYDEGEFEPELEITPEPSVAVGRQSGAAASMEQPPDRARGYAARLAVVVVAAVVVLGIYLLQRSLSSRPTPPRPQATSVQPPPAAMSAPAAPTMHAPAAPTMHAPAAPAMRAQPQAATSPATLAAPTPATLAAPMAEEALLHVQTDGPANFTVDGHATRPAADGALHLPPGRHKVVVTSALLAAPRSFEVELRRGDSLNKSARSGRGRLRLAVSPWAEVSVDGRSVGTTPIAPVELLEGAHTVTLKNGELGANLKKRVVVLPERETLLRVDMFSR